MSSGSRLKSRPLSALLAAAVVGTGAVALATPAAAATGGVLVYGLTEANQIVQFRADTPRSILATSPAITLAAGENLVGIDVRPATGGLYGVVDGPTADRLVVIDPATGALSGSVALSTQLSGDAFGVDFNPAVDRLRVVSSTGQNLRIVVDTGVVFTDTPLNGATADVRGAAYTNNVATPTTTLLYDFDVEGVDELFVQNPANNGTLSGGVPTGTNASDGTATPSVGLDIEAVTNVGYAVVENATGREVLYSFTPATGAFELIGAFNTASPVEDIAVASARYTVGDGSANEGSSAAVVVTRTGDLADTATVDIVPAAGSATAGDFDLATKTVTFAAGASAATATIALTADALAEQSETFTVTISKVTGPAGNDAATARRGTVTILDGPGCNVQATVALERATIIATGSSGVTVTAPASQTVDLFAYTRPSTTYRLVRTGVTGADGTVAFAALKPPANTRLYAQIRGCSANVPAVSKVLNVRTALSLFAKRNGTRSYTFSGDSLPARPGGLIVSLYRVTASGSQVLTAQTRASATTGDWVINRTFLGTGRFGFVVRTGQDLRNAPGASNVRPTLVF